MDHLCLWAKNIGDTRIGTTGWTDSACVSVSRFAFCTVWCTIVCSLPLPLIHTLLHLRTCPCGVGPCQRHVIQMCMMIRQVCIQTREVNTQRLSCLEGTWYESSMNTTGVDMGTHSHPSERGISKTSLGLPRARM